MVVAITARVLRLHAATSCVNRFPLARALGGLQSSQHVRMSLPGWWQESARFMSANANGPSDDKVGVQNEGEIKKSDLSSQKIASASPLSSSGSTTSTPALEKEQGVDEWEWVPPDRARAENAEAEMRQQRGEEDEDDDGDYDDNIKVDEALDAAVWLSQNDELAVEDYTRNRRKREASWTWESGLVDRSSRLIRIIPGEVLTVEEITACLEANGGEDIITVLGEVSNMREDSVIVTGRSETHILRLAKIIHKSMKKRGLRSTHESKPYDADEDWIVLDAGKTLVHLFTSDAREKVRLEDKLLPDRRDVMMEELHRDAVEINREDTQRRHRRTKRKRMVYRDE